MEKRLVIAVLLMVGVVYAVNLLSPPARLPDIASRPEADSIGRAVPAPAPASAPNEGALPQTQLQAPPKLESVGRAVETTSAEAPSVDTIWVEGPLYRLGFSTRGAALVVAEMLEYESLAAVTKGDPVQLVPPGVDDFLTHGWVVGQDTLDLRGVRFEVTPAGGLVFGAGSSPQTLMFTYQHPDAPFRLEIRYTFQSEGYEIDLAGQLSGVSPTGWWLIDMGTGLESNEWDPQQDYQQYLAYVAKGANSPRQARFSKLDPGERVHLDGPFDWIAVHTKYFVAALVRRPESSDETRFAGLRVTAQSEEYRARGIVSFPVSRAGSFDYTFYLGPMQPRPLAAVGYDLNQVAPLGYKWLQPVMRPLSGAITDLLVWSHRNLNLSYGWILILFGVGIRIILFPLYQKSMRSQMATMRVQPLMKEIQTKYKHDPQKLQQEMIKLYREHKINPLGGCLPMLLPFPILIALFFVFKDTIEFRGVPFLWLPDLSRHDPLFIVPVLMGASLFVMQWIGQRGVAQDNPQMKMIMYVMPVMMVVLFLKFAAGLNLYYATMNIASLPQQIYLARERRAASSGQPAPAKPAKAAKARS